ncbi:hypothetical protein D3C83_39430 [compost metagenome]
MVWQFGDNAWVHPYVSAGAVLDIERQHAHVDPIFQVGNRGERIVIQNEVDSGDRTELRGGGTLGAGAKFYATPKAFVNVGVIGTFTSPQARSVSLITGFGFDF